MGELLTHLHHSASGVYDSLAGGKVLSDDQAESLVDEVNKFKQGFQASDGSRVVDDEDAESMDADDVTNEEIKLRKS
jgi:F-type H+-transporting ATPase subunit alpha